jgi:D-serine deaminase-like pyridoxal phosphate-dependent protein
MDAAHWRQLPDPEASLRVLATVLTRKGQTVVLDAGRKTLGTIDPVPPTIRDVPGPIRMFHEEHLAIESTVQAPRPGAVVEIVPSYAPAAVTLHEVYHLVEQGRVIDVWPVLARSGGREGAR